MVRAYRFAIYKSAKSCVAANELLSDHFSFHMGVRQGENVFPLLFSLFLNDLHSFLQSSHVNLQMVHTLADDVEENIEMFLKLYLLLYADDAVLLAEFTGDLQRSVCAMREYCDLWKLNVNVIFSRRKTRKIPIFILGENELEVVTHCKYLGLTFNYNGKFTTAKINYMKKETGQCLPDSVKAVSCSLKSTSNLILLML